MEIKKTLQISALKGKVNRNSVFNLDKVIDRKVSAESLYSSGLSPSVSLPEHSSSLDSVDIDKINEINKELSELINSRLTAFAYFEEVDKGNRKIFKKDEKSGLDSFLDCEKEPDESRTGDATVSFSETYKKLHGLKRIYENKKKRLSQTTEELEKLLDEESDLNSRLTRIENKVTNAFLGIKEKNNGCRCKIC
jgi:hypothetical protein